MATPNVSSDMAQFFDFGEASNMIESLNSPEVSRPASRAGKHRVGCPAHGQEDDEGCLCAAFNQDVSLPDTLTDEVAPAEEFNTDFSSCFNNPEQMPMQMKRTALDTLHSVAEVSERTFGGFTGKKVMRCLGHQGPIEEDETEDKSAPKKGAAAARFPRAAVKILKDWMIAHIDHPYPSEEQKEMLAQQTGLTLSQISNWMANTRRRHKARPKRSSSPSIRPSTEPVNIPPGRTWESLSTYTSPNSTLIGKGRFFKYRLNGWSQHAPAPTVQQQEYPFERWKHSPPENEPAPMQAIAANVETFDFPDDNPHSAASSYRKENSNDSTGSFSVFRAPSTTSLETGLTILSSGSLGSHSSAAYSHSSRHSLGSFSSLKSKERRTFCIDRFKSKYDWTRHEKSLHLSLEKWICAPLGDVITCSSSGQRKCVYCDEINPSSAHLESHNHRACEEKGMEARTFYRKDHLRQHLRLMHGCKMTPSMEAWKAEVQVINSRCGFCDQTFEKWQDRCDHLAKEFRNGATMKNWKGCRGLDPHVAQHVTNAMPPYLIANESKSPFPFSATNSSSMKHPSLRIGDVDLEVLLPNELNASPMTKDFRVDDSASADTTQNPSPHTGTSPNRSPHPYATCWEILTLRLGRFAREHIEKHGAGSVTDEMLQSEARLILYDEDDPWHQTAADNPEWLNLFRKAHGLEVTGPVSNSISQHEVLEDLGLGHNARLDQSFNLNHFNCISKNFNDPVARARAFECTLAGSMALQQAGQMSVPITHMPGLTTSATTSGASNIPLTSFADFSGLNAAMEDFPGTGVGGLCIGDDGEIRTTSAPVSKGLESFMTPINEMSCNAAGEPIEGDFGFPAFSAAGSGFDIAATTAGFGSSLPVTSSGFGDLDFSGADNTQMMAWDDADLTFNMDMDLDLDLGMGETSGL
ncbi:hypothetical protein N0V90_007130 [Kalmusia sp. IMI 367209]|nr:hypothetical protein N0V90_007130 [Kalmusia sp. IMI 367209]